MARNIYTTKPRFNALRESAGDLEFHFTPLKNLCGMMETDTINLSETGSEENRRGSSFLSLSRLRSSAAGYGSGMTRLDNSTGPVARIEFDGKKLNNIRNVNVIPYDYFYNNAGRVWAGGNERSGSDVSEFEDSLTLKDGRDQIVDAIDYIVRIDVYLTKRCPNLSVWQRFLKDLEVFTDWAEKIHFYTDLNGFDYQRNEIPKSQIYGVYSGQMKQALEEGKKMGKRIYITESQLGHILENNGMLNEHVDVIDNTSDAEKFISMQWASPDDYWFIQVTQRKKDFRNYNKRHGGNSKWWNRVQGIDGTSRENFVGYGVVKGNTLQEAINCLHNIKIKLNPWAAQIIGQNEVQSTGNMEAIYSICDQLWARAYITINKRSMSRTQRIAQKGGPRAFDKESSRNHRDAHYYPWSMIDMDIDHPNAWSETSAALKKLNLNPAISHKSHDGMHYFFDNRDVMNYSEHSPEFSPIAKKYAANKQPGEAFTMKDDAKMIIYSPCGK